MNVTEDKQWISDQLARAEERMLARMGELSTRVAEQEERLSMKIEGVETALLTEFHKWASPMEARVRSHSAILRSLDEDFELLRERTKRLEDNK